MSGKAEGGVFQVRLSPPVWQALHAERGTETRSASGRALLLLGLQAIGYDMRALLPDIVAACQDDLAPVLHQHLLVLQHSLMSAVLPRPDGAPVEIEHRYAQLPVPPALRSGPPVVGGNSDPFDIGEEF